MTRAARGVGWALGAFAWVVVLTILRTSINAVLGDSAVAIAAVLVAQTVATALMWLWLRARLRAPHAVWITLVVLTVINTWAIAWVGASLLVMSNLSTDATKSIAEALGGAPTVGGVVTRVVTEQGPVLFTAALAFALRRPGPAFTSRRGRVVFTGVLIALAAISAWMAWTSMRAAYVLAGEIGQSSTVSGGQSVTLAHNLGTITVPSGWEANVEDTTRERPPWWLQLPESTGSRIAQSVIMRPEQTTTEATSSPSQVIALIVYSDQKSWRSARTRAAAMDSAKPYQLPSGALGEMPYTALTRTTRDAQGVDWKTAISISVPNSVAPLDIVIIIFHNDPAPPGDELVVDLLRPVRLKTAP